MALELEQSSVLNLIIDTLTDRLLRKLRIETTDATKAGVVRAGRLQDDPTLKKVNILIHPGGEDWPDEINTNTGPDLGGPTYTLSGAYGSAFWRRRFIIEMQIFYPNEISRINTRTKALVILSRVHNAVVTMNPTVGPDSFGETAISVQVLQAHLREGGGEGDFNWRGELVIEFLTEIEPPEEDE